MPHHPTLSINISHLSDTNQSVLLKSFCCTSQILGLSSFRFTHFYEERSLGSTGGWKKGASSRAACSVHWTEGPAENGSGTSNIRWSDGRANMNCGFNWITRVQEHVRFALVSEWGRFRDCERGEICGWCNFFLIDWWYGLVTIYSCTVGIHTSPSIASRSSADCLVSHLCPSLPSLSSQCRRPKSQLLLISIFVRLPNIIKIVILLLSSSFITLISYLVIPFYASIKKNFRRSIFISCDAWNTIHILPLQRWW